MCDLCGFVVLQVISSGLNAIREMASSRPLPGLHGPVIELFECDPVFFEAVEVSAGNSLFHVVVDTEDTAALILQHLNEQRTGRVTFMPINRISAKAVAPPASDEVIPMISRLRFDEKFRSIFAQVCPSRCMRCGQDRRARVRVLMPSRCVLCIAVCICF